MTAAFGTTIGIAHKKRIEGCRGRYPFLCAILVVSRNECDFSRNDYGFRHNDRKIAHDFVIMSTENLTGQFIFHLLFSFTSARIMRRQIFFTDTILFLLQYHKKTVTSCCSFLPGPHTGQTGPQVFSAFSGWDSPPPFQGP